MTDYNDLFKAAKGIIKPQQQQQPSSPVMRSSQSILGGHYQLIAFDPAMQIFPGCNYPKTVVIQMLGAFNVGNFSHCFVSSNRDALTAAQDVIAANASFLSYGIDITQAYSIGGQPLTSTFSVKTCNALFARAAVYGGSNVRISGVVLINVEVFDDTESNPWAIGGGSKGGH